MLGNNFLEATRSAGCGSGCSSMGCWLCSNLNNAYALPACSDQEATHDPRRGTCSTATQNRHLTWICDRRTWFPATDARPKSRRESRFFRFSTKIDPKVDKIPRGRRDCSEYCENIVTIANIVKNLQHQCEYAPFVCNGLSQTHGARPPSGSRVGAVKRKRGPGS